MTTQTTTTTEETVAPSGPTFGLPEIPPWNPPSGSRLERRRSFEVQSPRPEHINPLPPSSDPFGFQSFGSASRQQESGLRIHRGRSPVTPTPSAGRLGRQTRTPVRPASEPSDDGNYDEGGDNRGSRGGGNPPDPLTHRILLGLLAHQVLLPALHAGLLILHLIHRLLEPPTKKEETDPMPSQRNPSSKISNSSSSYSFPRTIISILTMQTRYCSHLVFVLKEHPRSLQNWPSFKHRRTEVDGERLIVSWRN